MNRAALGDTGADERSGSAFRMEHCRDRVTAALADDHNNLALAGLIAKQATVAAVFLHVGGLGIAAEIAAIDFNRLSFTADNAALHFLCHGFAQLVQQDECRLVRRAQVAAEGERALALHLVAEHGNGRQIAAQGQLVRTEQRAAGDRKILFATLAAKAERAIRAAALVSLNLTAGRADRSAIGFRPTNVPEGGFGFRISHAEDLSEAQGLCRFAEKEVLSHECHL